MFPGVTHTTQALVVSSFLSSFSRHFAPPAMSASDIHGCTAWMTAGNHCRRKWATSLLGEPDQLIKSSIALLSRPHNCHLAVNGRCRSDVSAGDPGAIRTRDPQLRRSEAIPGNSRSYSAGVTRGRRGVVKLRIISRRRRYDRWSAAYARRENGSEARRSNPRPSAWEAIGELPDSTMISIAWNISVPDKRGHGWTEDDRSGRADATSERAAAGPGGRGPHNYCRCGCGSELCAEKRSRVASSNCGVFGSGR